MISLASPSIDHHGKFRADENDSALKTRQPLVEDSKMDQITFAVVAEEAIVETTEQQFELSIFELDMVGGGSSASVLS